MSYFDASMVDVKLIVTYGGVDSNRYIAEGCVAVSHEAIECSSVHGRGWNHSIQVTVAGSLGPASTATLRYAPPSAKNQTQEMCEGCPGISKCNAAGGCECAD